jgi:hypothetical protein
MSQYIRTSYHNPCPLCNDTKGKCRTEKLDTNSLRYFCMEGKQGELADHRFNFHKPDKNGTWGIYYLRDPNYKKPSEEIAYLRKEKQEAEEKARRERFWASLSGSERNTNYLAIYKRLGLLKEDRDNLTKRGLTDEQINKGKFFSIRGQVELPLTVSLQFPGVNPHKANNNSIGYSKTNGFSCPAFNYEGEIIGYQIRNNTPNDEFSAKYYWAKSKKIKGTEVTSHLQNGELPLTYHGTGQDTLYIVEGILKPYIAHCVHGIDVLGAAGGQWASSPQQLIEIAKNYKEIVVIPDGGAVKNKNITHQIKSVKDLILKELNIEVQIAWYQQFEKSDGDIDEIESFNPVLISFETWEAIAQKVQFRQDKKLKLEKYTKYTPDKTINVKFIADSLKEKIDGCKVFGIKSAKNTGKSFWLKELVAEIPARYILIGNRKTLTKSLSQDLPHFTYVDMSVTGEDCEYIWSEDNNWQHRLAIVLDSLLKLKNIDFNGTIVLIDEAEQFLDSLLLGSTHVKKFRGQILALLMDKLKECGAIILCDADLSDYTVDYFVNVSGKPSYKIENTYNENKRNLFFYENEEEILSIVHQTITDGDNIMVVSDSKKQLTALNDVYASKGIKTLLLTRENLNDNPNLHNYLCDKGSLIKKNKIQVVLASPVIQSGISLEIPDYLNAYFGIFKGVVAPNVARQMLIRERGQCDRHVWASGRGLGYSNDFDVYKIRESQKFKEYILPESVEYMQFAQGIDWEDAVIKVAQLMKQNKLCKDLNMDTVANLTAKNNIQRSDYGDILKEQLIKEGYQIIEVGNFPFDLEVNLLIEHQRTINNEKEALRIVQAPDIDENQAKVLGNKDGLKEADRDKLAKYYFKKKLPDVPVNPDLILDYVVKDSYRKINAIENYVLALNTEVSNKLDIQNLNYLLFQSEKGGVFWTNDSRTRTVMSNLFHALEIQKWIDQDLVELNDDLFLTLNKHRRTLSLYGIKWHKQSYRLPVIKKLLALFGFTTYTKFKNKYGIKPLVNINDFNLFVQSLTNKYKCEIDIKYNTTHASAETGAYNAYVERNEGEIKRYEVDNPALGFSPSQKPRCDSYGTKNAVITPLPEVCDWEKRVIHPSEIEINNNNINDNFINENIQTNNLIGTFVKYVNPNYDDYQRGTIEKIDAIGVWIRDCVENTLIPCDPLQVLNLEGDTLNIILPTYPKAVEQPKIYNSPMYYHTVANPIIQTFVLDNYEEIDKNKAQIGDYLRSYKGVVYQIIGDAGHSWITTAPQAAFNKRYDSFNILRI